MKAKLGAISLTAIGLFLNVATSSFANEAPVVDATQQPQDAASTQPVSQPSGSWQSVSSSPAPSSASSSGWQPVGATGPAPSPANGAAHDSTSGAASIVTETNNENDASPVATGSEKQRLARLEQQMANYNRMNAPQEISELQQKIAQLQGQLEVEQHTVKTLTDQQKLYYQDLQHQLTDLQQKRTSNANTALTQNSGGKKQSEFAKKSVAVSVPPTEAQEQSVQEDETKVQLAKTVKADLEKNSANTSSTVDVAQNQSDSGNLLQEKASSLSDVKLYDKAFHALSSKDYKSAKSDFTSYLSQYPKGRFAMNAHFWLGEIGLMHEKYQGALKHFQAVVSDYPHSNKVPDAKLKIAMIHAAVGKMDEARQEFKEIRKSYPGTTAAQLASIRLQELANATKVTLQ